MGVPRCREAHFGPVCESKSAAHPTRARKTMIMECGVNFAHFLCSHSECGGHETVARFTHIRTCIRIRKPTHRFPPLLRFCSHAGKSKTGIPNAPVPRGLQRQQILATRDPFLSLVCAYQ